MRLSKRFKNDFIKNVSKIPFILFILCLIYSIEKFMFETLGLPYITSGENNILLDNINLFLYLLFGSLILIIIAECIMCFFKVKDYMFDEDYV